LVRNAILTKNPPPKPPSSRKSNASAPPPSARPKSSAPAAFSAFQSYANPVLHRQLQAVYALCKTRGYKRVVKLFPHEVADVEPVVQALSKALTAAMSDPAAKAALEKLGGAVPPMLSLAEAAKEYEAQTARFRAIAKAIKLEAQ
jgi:hypothetical protein